MFSELPKLLARDFAIGSFLPSVVFVAVVWAVTKAAGLGGDVLKSMEAASPVGATAIALVSWLFAVALAALNRQIYRLLEGYGKFNPLRLFAFVERTRFTRLMTELAALKQKTSSSGPDDDANARKIEIGCLLAQRYPDHERWLLPTSFGNTIRAFEVYPRVVYGLEGIQGWPRLLPLVSKEYLEAINAAKAQTDFWVNLLMLTIPGFVYYVVVGRWLGGPFLLWVAIAALIACVIFYAQSRNAAEQWGDLIKAAFDVYVLDLQKKLGIVPADGGLASRELWQRRSQSMIFRRPPA